MRRCRTSRVSSSSSGVLSLQAQARLAELGVTDTENFANVEDDVAAVRAFALEGLGFKPDVGYLAKVKRADFRHVCLYLLVAHASLAQTVAMVSAMGVAGGLGLLKTSNCDGVLGHGCCRRSRPA